MPIICLSGDAGAGKDSFADVLVKEHGFQKIALAAPLKELAAHMTGMRYNDFDQHGVKDAELDSKFELDFHHIDKLRAYIEKNWGYEISYEVREAMEEFHGTVCKTPRDILRVVGTKLLRQHLSDTLWIDLALNKIKTAGGKVIITDCRFENERDAFGGMGALLVLIKRGDKEAEKHEHDLGKEAEYDVVFDNSGTFTEFTSNVNMWYTLRRNELEFYTVFKYE